MSTRRTIFKVIAAATVAGSLAGANHVLAQMRATAQTATTGTERVGLKGYDPVAYFTVSTPTPGVAEYDYVYDGVRYLFANARHRELFKANPEKYAPQFGGSCAMNMANGVRRESDPTIWVIADGKLYVFAGTTGAGRFRTEADTAAARGAENWKTLRNSPSQ
jgi:YHS domain-containing protein